MLNYLGPVAGIIMFINGIQVENTTVKISQPSSTGNVRIVAGKGNADRDGLYCILLNNFKSGYIYVIQIDVK